MASTRETPCASFKMLPPLRPVIPIKRLFWLLTVYICFPAFVLYINRVFKLFRVWLLLLSLTWGSPGGSDGKESACNAGDLGLIPGLGGSPGGGHGSPPQCSCLGNPLDRGAWWATPMGSKRSGQDWATKHTARVKRLPCCSVQSPVFRSRCCVMCHYAIIHVFHSFSCWQVLGYFLVLSIANCTAVNLSGHTFWWTQECISLENVPTGAFWGSQGVQTFSFRR